MASRQKVTLPKHRSGNHTTAHSKKPNASFQNRGEGEISLNGQAQHVFPNFLQRKHQNNGSPVVRLHLISNSQVK